MLDHGKIGKSTWTAIRKLAIEADHIQIVLPEIFKAVCDVNHTPSFPPNDPELEEIIMRHVIQHKLILRALRLVEDISGPAQSFSSAVFATEAEHDPSVPLTTDETRNIKRKPLTCDICHNRSMWFSASAEDPSKCQSCVDYDHLCTYNRPAKKRAAKSGKIQPSSLELNPWHRHEDTALDEDDTQSVHSSPIVHLDIRDEEADEGFFTASPRLPTRYRSTYHIYPVAPYKEYASIAPCHIHLPTKWQVVVTHHPE